MNVKAVGIACLCAIPVICLLSLLGLSLVNSNSGSGNLTFNETSDVEIQNTQIAADFSIELVSGEEYQLSNSDSKITIIDFWSSWCIPCVEEAPMLQKFYLDHQDLGVDMLGIAIWDTGVTSAAVPVKKHPTKFFISSGFIFLSLTFTPLDLAIFITSLLVIPSKKESGIGVCISPDLSLKNTFAPVASATLPS